MSLEPHTDHAGERALLRLVYPKRHHTTLNVFLLTPQPPAAMAHTALLTGIMKVLVDLEADPEADFELKGKTAVTASSPLSP